MARSFSVTRTIFRLRHENARLKKKLRAVKKHLERTLIKLYPCKSCLFQRATHARNDVIFGIGYAELCEECAREVAKEEGSEWVKLQPPDYARPKGELSTAF